MNKIKFMIFILIMILVILIAGFIVVKDQILTKNKDIVYENKVEERQDGLIELDKNSIEEKNTYTIFTLNDLIQKSINNDPNNKAVYYIQNVYCLQTYENASYYTYGISKKDGNNTIEELYLKVNVDYMSGAYDVKNLNQEEYNEAKLGKINKVEKINIALNENNKYDTELLSTDKIIKRYVEDFIFKVKYVPEKAYETLDAEYKSKKFKNLEEFKIYCKEQSERFSNFSVKKCGKEINEGYSQYVATDSNEHYYRINAYPGISYKIVLDNYTIETVEDAEKYKKMSTEAKVTQCIYKYLKILKEKDYQCAYKYLDETFKKQNYDTLEKFEQYANNNLKKYNTVKINEISKIGNVYSCKVTLKDSDNNNSENTVEENQKLTIIILLKEGTDFVVSFSIIK